MEPSGREIKINHCKRCGYNMVQRGEKPPKFCANKRCHSPYWNKERERNPEAYKKLRKNKYAYA